jgi:NAD dependent epimerase/dehydratase family enzyme
MARRKKVSTTISPESYAYLRALIRSKKVENLAQALDYVLDEIRRADNRARLEAATAAYYGNAPQEVIDEENQIAADFASLGAEVDPDA